MILVADYEWNINSLVFLSPCSTTEPFSPAALIERESQAAREQMRQRWESLRLELKTKLQLLQKTLEQDHKQPVQTFLCCYCQHVVVVEVKFASIV